MPRNGLEYDVTVLPADVWGFGGIGAVSLGYNTV